MQKVFSTLMRRMMRRSSYLLLPNIVDLLTSVFVFFCRVSIRHFSPQFLYGVVNLIVFNTFIGIFIGKYTLRA